MLASFFRRILSPGTSRPEGPEADLYESIVARSRDPIFYQSFGVPDTVEGRYELLVLHGYAVMSRLKECGEEAEALNQRLFDLVFSDMDDNLRELGVSDLKVGVKVKKLAQAFYGRAVAYENGLAADDRAELDDAIARNVFGTADPAEGHVGAMADYLRTTVDRLAGQPIKELLAGNVDFGPLELPSRV